MCGFAGIVRYDGSGVDPDLLRDLGRRLAHRGPDDTGYLSWSPGQSAHLAADAGQLPPGAVGMVHNRLSILDLSSAGNQPMATPDGRFCIVFNGEIYNFLELREELESAGWNFRSRSDTEVLLAAYAQWGAASLPRLVGMFAFAVLDTRAGKLFLARDPFGIKPLYYHCDGNGLAFASEIKALLVIPGVGRKVNPQCLYEYFRSGFTDLGPQTLFADVRQFPPAHYTEISLDSRTPPEPVRYWDIDLAQRAEMSFEAAAAKLREMFLRNIELHLRSDVQVGSCLSGGIDSSAIVAAMRHVGGKDLDIQAFSFIPDDPRLSEQRWVNQAAESASAEVHQVTPTADQLVTDLDDLIRCQDEPFGSTTIYAQYRVFRLAHEAGIKVMLDGQGADELLAGYRPYLGDRLASLVRRGRLCKAAAFWMRASRQQDTSRAEMACQAARLMLPHRLATAAGHMFARGRGPAWVNTAWAKEHNVDRGSLYLDRGQDTLRRRLRQTLLATSVPMLLRYEDRNSMAHSVESRVPFLTTEMVEFVLALPEAYIIDPSGLSKWVFREAMRGLVPQAILARRDKIGFATPERQWLLILRPWVDNVLNSDAAENTAPLDIRAVRRAWRKMSCDGRRFDPTIWRAVNLIRWGQCYNVSFEA